MAPPPGEVGSSQGTSTDLLIGRLAAAPRPEERRAASVRAATHRDSQRGVAKAPAWARREGPLDRSASFFGEFLPRFQSDSGKNASI